MRSFPSFNRFWGSNAVKQKGEVTIQCLYESWNIYFHALNTMNTWFPSLCWFHWWSLYELVIKALMCELTLGSSPIIGDDLMDWWSIHCLLCHDEKVTKSSSLTCSHWQLYFVPWWYRLCWHLLVVYFMYHAHEWLFSPKLSLKQLWSTQSATRCLHSRSTSWINRLKGKKK